MKGRKNKRVPLQFIARFPKMQQYQPLEFVAEALKTSKSVILTQESGEWYIQRMEPFVMPDHLKAKAVAKGQSPPRTWQQPKAASGFENYFAEGPLPPDVAAEEAEIYNEENTFEE